ncbi:MAG: AraC family transcriptional regulator [Ignavibacteriae bacterium]|nr:AraC family transcriptional regulator [Ignavibacteriota bacterium]MCB9244121.1 AraC family transcriptional regulator [Ignavibacteriales bacterium]
MDYNTEQLDEIKIIGLKIRTTNENNQAGTDIFHVWDRIFKEDIPGKIPNKTGDEMYGIYFDYEGDYTKPYSFMVGCPVSSLDDIPEGMDSVVLNSGKYAHIVAKGKMPDCIVETWQEIWNSDLDRAYGTDYEVYGAKSQDPGNAEVDVYLSVK